MIWVRSSLYFVWFLAVSVAMHLIALPTLALPRKAVVAMAKSWSAMLLWGLRVFAGLKLEIRGNMPPSGVLIAAKHMSMWDTLALYMLLDDPIVVMKEELRRIPFYGWFASRADMIFVDRRHGARALRQMAAHAARALGAGRSLVIFPEGSRRRPGAAPAYKSGIAALYGRLNVPCVPVALNSGLFWTGPGGFLKRPGTVVLEFLPPVPVGLDRQDFMAQLESAIETATGSLVAEGRTRWLAAP